MSDTHNIIDMFAGLPRQSAAAGVADIDSSPDDAMRAVELSRATSVPATTILGDLESFERQHKATLASSIISNNSFIADFIHSNPIATKIANDDYGNLDEASQSVAGWKPDSLGSLGGFIRGAYRGVKEGFGEGPIGSWMFGEKPEDVGRNLKFIQENRLSAATMSVIATPVELVLRSLSAGIKGVIEGAKDASEEIALLATMGDTDAAKRFSREVAAFVEWRTTAPLGHAPHIPPEVVSKARETLNRAKPWLDEGKEPPLGVDPVIDEIKIKQSDHELGQLEEMEKRAQKSLLRERSPETFADFMRQHVQNSEIGIGADAIRKLYGDKEPVWLDGVLGFVPRLGDQLRLAEMAGTDVQIPLADWLAHVDPEVAKALRDDIRVRPGGVTKNEAVTVKEMVQEAEPSQKTRLELEGEEFRLKNGLPPATPEEVVANIKTRIGQIERDRRLTKVEGEDYPPHGELNELRRRLRQLNTENVDKVREAAGLRPLVDVDARKLTLRRSDLTLNDPLNTGKGHSFELVDQSGEVKAALFIGEENGGKRLYIDDIRGVEESTVNSFGPRAMRDLLRQLKTEFPNAEELTGFRVSGARDKAGSWETKGKVTIKLNEPDHTWTINEFTDEWQRLERAKIGDNVAIEYKPREQYTPHEDLIAKEVKEVLNRIVPEVEHRTVNKVEVRGREVAGAYITQENVQPLILVALNAKDAGHVARHEAIHFLWDYGFFTEAEWSALEKAAKEGGWLKKYDIERRYSKLGAADRLEEAIAEEFGHWGSQTEAPRKHYNDAVQKAFAKLADFFKQILDAMKEMFGHTPTIDELFEKIESGEVGRRPPPEGGQHQQVTKEMAGKQGELDVTNMADKDAFARAAAIGMTEDQLRRYLKLIEKQRAEDADAAMKKAVEVERRKQTEEWKRNEQAVREEVVDDYKARPDVQADLYFRTGELYGESIGKPKFARDALTAEQRKGLPESYVADKGMLPDDVAGLFGYTSGSELVTALSEFAATRKASGMQPMVFQRRVIQAQIDQVMAERYGSLRENTLEAIKDQILNETQLDLLHEETVALAMKAKAQIPLPKDLIKDEVLKQIDASPVRGVSSDKYLSAAGKSGKLAEMHLLKGDFTEALKEKQRQYMAIIAAREAKKIEGEVAQFEKKAKTYQPREIPKAVDPEFGTYVQKLLGEAGFRMRITPDEVARGIEFYGYGTLDNFVTDKSSYGFELNVPEGYEPKPFEQMSVGEFRELRDAVGSLDHAGRDSRKVIVAGEKVDFADWVQGAVEKLEQRPVRDIEGVQKGGRLFYQLDASLTRVEEMMKSFDFREEMGPFFEAVVVPYERSKAKAFDMLSDLSKKLKEIKGFGKDWQRSFNTELPGDFVFDTYNQVPMKLTRWNMMKMMLNMGTESNFNQLARGIAASWLEGKSPTPDHVAQAAQRIEQFVHTHATENDWKFVQHIWDIFKGWQKEADTLYRNLSGTPPKWIPDRPITTQFGEMAGGYFPLIPDRLRPVGRGIKEAGDTPVPKGPLGQDFFRATTHTPFYKERVGGSYFVDLTNGLENIAGRMQQVIHDIAYRDFVVNTGKIIYNPKVMNAIRKHYGPEYAAQLDPWLKRVANEYTGMELELQGWNNVLKQFKMNLIAHALPLNYAVMLSPSLGTANLKDFVAFNANRAANKKLVADHSKEVRHLIYNLDRDLTEQLKVIVDKQDWTSFQKRAVEWLFKPLTWLEQQTRSVTFYSKFMEGKEKGYTDAQAADLADSHVRERHGSMAVGDLPALMANKNQFVQIATVFMGYFNTMRNWMRQAPDQIRQGDMSGFAKTIWGTIGVSFLMNAALFQRRKENDTLFTYLGKSLLSTPLTMVPFVREAWSYTTENQNPTSPIFSMYKASEKLVKDGVSAWQGKKVKRPVRDTANVLGQAFGVPGTLQVGRTGGFMYDVSRKEQRPRDITEWMRGILTGEARLRK